MGLTSHISCFYDAFFIKFLFFDDKLDSDFFDDESEDDGKDTLN